MEQYRIVLIPSQRVTFLQLCSRASLTGASTIKAEQINGYHIAQGVKMSAMGTGNCGDGPALGAMSMASNPRKFSKKIELGTQWQDKETANRS
eukprot:superscaffoldBa00002856_g15474